MTAYTCQIIKLFGLLSNHSSVAYCDNRAQLASLG
jgi:hypothetical protein